MTFGLPQVLRSLLQKGPSLARVSSRGVLSVTGSQAAEFLNGMLASSISDVPKRPFYSAILNPQGRVIYDLLVYSNHDAGGRPGYLLEYDSRSSEAGYLHDILKRFVLRSKVKLRDVTSEFDVWAAWNSEATFADKRNKWQFAQSGAAEPVWPNTTEHWPWGLQDHVLIDRRAPGMGSRYLVRRGDKPPVTSSFEEVSSEMYTLHRILHGVPEGIDDISPMNAFPMESNLDIMGGCMSVPVFSSSYNVYQTKVDFRKGCYVGQELTVRTYHTGAVRKRIFPVMIKSSNGELSTTKFSPGLDIKPTLLSSSEQRVPRPRGSGRLLSSTHGLGLALMRLEHLAGVEKKELDLRLRSESDDNLKTYHIEHWWPEWWPQWNIV
ncbi:Aminomethyltransferase folate-binding domain-containing protein [Marasmius fiardii PR-910]|nr:Aminomethyltransferase folate-binding domain-containing protein [Marasmius fiardii PR-910]